MFQQENYTIKADIKKDFVHHFIDANTALNSFGNESESANNGDEETEELDMSSEEEYEEEEEEEYADNQNYENYETEYYS